MRTLAIVFSSLALATAVASAETFRSDPEPDPAIPDNNPLGVSDTLTVAPSCTMTDVDIELEITHTWVGDLKVTITHGNTTVMIVDRPAQSGPTGFGCNSDWQCTVDRQVVLDDDGGVMAIECSPPGQQCATCFPPSGPLPIFTPNEALSAFDNADQAGDWIITVSDNAADDTGTLCAWEVRTSCNPQAVEPATWGKIKARYQK